MVRRCGSGSSHVWRARVESSRAAHRGHCLCHLLIHVLTVGSSARRVGRVASSCSASAAASPRPSCPATSPRVEPSAKAARRGATNDFFLPHNFRRALRARIGRSHEPCNFIRLCPSAPRFGATRAALLPASSSDACCSVSTQRHRHGVQSLRRASGNPSLCRQA